LRLVVRDYLKLAGNSKEADRIITGGGVLVDGKVRREPRFAVGFMDVLEVPVMNRSYRVLLNHRGRLTVNEIPHEEASMKLCRVDRKQFLRGQKIQLTLHDGKNLIGDNSFKPGDVVKLGLPNLGILGRLPLERGMLAFITGGKNIGSIGRIEEMKTAQGQRPGLIVLKSGERIFEASREYVFIVGKERPEISVEG
jgi:small subunit ribosomal protein S4e